MASPASAQDENTTPHVISSTRPISAELRQALDDWLAFSPPSDAIYYAVTYTQPIDSASWYVSMVGLDLASPDEEWIMTGDPETGKQWVVWLDTVIVHPDGTVTQPFKVDSTSSANKKISMPALGPGGGSYVLFPWEPSKAVEYSRRGVSPTTFGDVDFSVVHFISGSTMGTGAANDKVYASAGGTITHVCEANGVAAVKISGGGDHFLYGNLVPNSLLQINQAFQTAGVIGSVKHGSFLSTCGSALQVPTKWELIWGFVAQDNIFRVEGCHIVVPSVGVVDLDLFGYWLCGNNRIVRGGYLAHYGNIAIDPETGSVGVHLIGEGAGGGPSFWNYFLIGAKNIFDFFVTNNLPEHNSASTLINPIMQSVKIIFRIALVILHGNFNFIPALGMITFTIGIKLAMQGVMFLVGLYRVIR